MLSVGAVVVAIAVTVVISIPISIPIAVAVSVAAAAPFGSVEDECHVLVFLLPVNLLQLRKHTPFKQSCAYYKDGTVCQFLNNLRVGYQLHRRTVYQHIVILFPYGLYYMAQLARKTDR